MPENTVKPRKYRKHAETKRTNQAKTVLSDSEYDSLKAASAYEGITISGYMVKAALARARRFECKQAKSE